MRDSKTKVVVRISDGLGDQLFQFALGRYIADVLGCDMFFDRSNFIVSKNMTFSWWGAYLGDESGLTIFPRQWFDGLETPESCVPSEWQALSNEDVL